MNEQNDLDDDDETMDGYYNQPDVLDEESNGSSQDVLDVDKYLPPLGSDKFGDDNVVTSGDNVHKSKDVSKDEEEQKLSTKIEKELSLETKLTLLVNNDKMADVYFLIPKSNTIGNEEAVGDHRVAGHRVMLALRSPVFEALLYGLMSESLDKCPEIPLPDIEFNGFMTLLNYLYTDKVDIDASNVIQTSCAARKYMIDKLTADCDSYLKREINPSNILTILNNCLVYNDVNHIDLLLTKFDKMAAEAFNDESFLNVSKDLLIQIVNRDRLPVAEVDLFKAISRWTSAECIREGIAPEDARHIRTDLGIEILHKTRFPTMPLDDFAFRFEIVDGHLTPEEQSTFFYKSDRNVSTEDTEPLPRASCSTYRDGEPSQATKKQKVEPQVGCSCAFCSRSGMIHPTTKSSSVAGHTYIARRFRSFKHGKTCETHKIHKIDFTVSIPIIATGIGIFGTKCGRPGEELEVTVELIEQSTGTVVASGKLRFEAQQALRSHHVTFTEPVLINPNTIYTASSCFDGKQPSHTYHGVHGKRIITITSRTPEPIVEEEEDEDKEVVVEPTRPRTIVRLFDGEVEMLEDTRHGQVPEELRLEKIKKRLNKLQRKYNKKAEIVEEPKEVFKQVTFTFFKTESCKSLNGSVDTYTGDTRGCVGQIPHILFEFN